MKVLFLIEDEKNETASNLINAFKGNDGVCSLDVISYCSNKKSQCTIVNDGDTQALSYNDRIYSPRDYDAALLWSWGTADTGRKYLRIFEDSNVPVLNSTYATVVTDSKINFTKKLQQNKIKTPKTMFFSSALALNSISQINEKLGQPPYVFKADYGTQGSGINFAASEEDVHHFAKKLQGKEVDHQAFLVQEFMGDSEMPIFHYRLFVIGADVLSKAILITAQSPLAPSNISKGGDFDFVDINGHLKKLALDATRTAELAVAGVDIMVPSNGKLEDAVVIEVNDGAGTKTFDRHGLKASENVAEFFINSIQARQRKDN